MNEEVVGDSTQESDDAGARSIKVFLEEVVDRLGNIRL